MKMLDYRRVAWSAAGIALLAVLGLAFGPLVAQTSISTDGVVESTSGGFRFPDGTIQMTAAASPAPVEDTGQRACADALGTTISCSGTGQDGELQPGVAWPTPRLIDNGDGTVTDNLTGLIWLRETNCFGQEAWLDALSDANELASGACSLTDGSMATDWRLPNIKELLSLLDYGQSDPALPPGHPFLNVDSASGFYWSSTTRPFGPTEALAVSLAKAIVTQSGKETAHYFWAVRGGQ